MSLPDEKIAQLAVLAQAYYSHDDAQRANAQQQLAAFNVVPQNFLPFIDVLGRTTDVYLLQFVVQSLRRIIIKFVTHLAQPHVLLLAQTIVKYFNTHVTSIPHSAITTLAQLFGTVMRYFWMAMPEIRPLVGDVAQMLATSPQHCYVGCNVLAQILDEMSAHRSNSMAATSSNTSIQLSRSVITSFGQSMVPAIMVATTSVLFQLLSSIGYKQSASYTQSGHEWNKYPLTTAIQFDATAFSQQQFRDVLKIMLEVMLKSMRFDFSGLGKVDEDDVITFPTPSLWKPLTSNNFLFLMVLFISQNYASDKIILDLCVQLITGYISFKTSNWASTIDRFIAIKNSCMFVVIIFKFLQEPSIAGQPDSPPRFLEEPALFQSTAQLLNTIFKTFQLSEVINSFHPLLTSFIHMNPQLAQMYEQIRAQLDSHFSQTFVPVDQIAGRYGADATRMSPPAEPLSNVNIDNPNMQRFGPLEQILTDATQFAQPQHPCREFQKLLFSHWISELYKFTIQVYTIGFPQNFAGSNSNTSGNSDISIQSLVTCANELGDVRISELMDIHQSLLSLWASLAASYSTTPTAFQNPTGTNGPTPTIMPPSYEDVASEWPSRGSMTRFPTKPRRLYDTSLSALSNILDFQDDDDDTSWDPLLIDKFTPSTAVTVNKKPAKAEEATLISLQHHNDYVMKKLIEHEKYGDIVSELVQFLPQICTVYIKALISSFGAVYEEASFEQIMTSNIDELYDFYFKSQYLQEQFGIFCTICRLCPEALHGFVSEVYLVLKTSYIQQLTILPQVAKRLVYELNNGAHKIMQKNASSVNKPQNANVQQPYYVYSTLLSTLFSEAHERNNVINFSSSDKAFLIQLHRTESQLSILMFLASVMFQPKNNFFNIKFGAHEQEILIKIHSDWAVMMWEVFRLYSIRYGHYNTFSTPMSMIDRDLVPQQMQSISLETLLLYLSTTPGLMPHPVNNSAYGMSQQSTALFSISNPLSIAPTSSYLVYSLLHGVGSFMDSLVYRAYMVKTQRNPYSESILSSTYEALLPVLISLPNTSDIKFTTPLSQLPTQSYFGQPIANNCTIPTPEQLAGVTNGVSDALNGNGMGLIPTAYSETPSAVNFHGMLNLAMFFNTHCLNVFALRTSPNFPIVELSMSFMLHISTTMTLSILLPISPANASLLDRFHTISIARTSSPLPLPTPFSWAVEARFTTRDASGNEVPTPLMVYSLPLCYGTPTITNAQYSDNKIIPYLPPRPTPSLTMGTPAEFTEVMQQYYELISRLTRRNPLVLTTPWNAMFGAIRAVLDNTSTHAADIDLFSNVIICICAGMIGAGGVNSGEHIFTWVQRFLSLLVRAGMQCATLMYADKSDAGTALASSRQVGTDLSLDLQRLSLKDDQAQFTGGADLLSNSLLSALDSALQHSMFEEDRGDNDDNNHTAFTKAIASIYIHPTVTSALTQIFAFLTTCASNRSISMRGILDQSSSLILAFLRTTYRMYTKNIDLSALTSPNQTNDDDDISKGINEDRDSPKPPSKTPIIPLPYHNEYYITCLTSVITLCERLIDTMLSRTNTVSSPTGYIDSLEDLPPYFSQLLQETIKHVYNIPHDVILANIELLQAYLQLIYNTFNTLIPMLTSNLAHDIITFNIGLCVGVLDAFHHLNVSHPRYHLLQLACNALLSFYQYEPKSLHTIEITSHDVLYHLSQTHVAPTYYSYLTDAMLNGGGHATGQWQNLLSHQAHVGSYQVDNAQNQAQLFNTSTLTADQHSMLSVMGYLNSHIVDNVMPSNLVSYYHIPQALSAGINAQTSFQEQQRIQQQQITLQHQQTALLLQALNSHHQQIDIPLLSTILQSNTQPYPLSRSVVTLQCIFAVRQMTENSLKQIPTLSTTILSVFGTIFFDGPENAPPCVLKLIPFFIHNYPKVWDAFVKLLSTHVSPPLCNIAKVDPTLVQTRIQQLARVLQIWAKCVVTSKRGDVDQSELAVLNIPSVNNGTSISQATGYSSQQYSSQQYHTFDINTLCDQSHSIVLKHLSKAITGLVNKPNI